GIADDARFIGWWFFRHSSFTSPRFEGWAIIPRLQRGPRAADPLDRGRAIRISPKSLFASSRLGPRAFCARVRARLPPDCARDHGVTPHSRAGYWPERTW